LSDFEALRKTLIWAVDGPGEPVLDLDLDTLVGAVKEHRVTSRLLWRLVDESRAAPEPLTSALVDLHRNQATRMHAQMELFARIRAAVRAADPGAEVFPLKGFSLFALTGSPKHVRASNKLDVIASDPARVVAALPDEDWVIQGDGHPHEFAVSPSVIVYASFPVVGFPAADSAAADFDPAAGTGAVRVPRRFGRSLIRFEELAAHPAASAVPLDGPVSSPAMAALIRCVHSYLGYTMFPELLPVATCFLDEVAQVRELLALEGFVPQEFDELVARYDAGLAAAFVRRLSVQLLGADPFAATRASAALPADDKVWFPQDLWWDGVTGFPAYLGWDARELVVRSPQHPSLGDTLGADSVVLRGGEEVVIRLEPGDRAGTRFLFHADDLRHSTLTCRADPDRLLLRLSLPETGADRFAVMSVADGFRRYELFAWPGQSRTAHYTFEDGPKPTADNKLRPARRESAICHEETVGERHLLSIAVPWDGTGGPDAGVLRLIVRARQQRAPWGEVERTLVVPLAVSVVN
jgi:hypothetical protein